MSEKIVPSGIRIACDTETTGLNPWKGARPFAFSFCNEEGKTGFFRGKVNPVTRGVTYPRDGYWEIKDFFADPSRSKIFFNAKFDIRMLEAIDIKVRGRIEEVGFAVHHCNSLEPSYKLKDLAKKYVDIGVDDQLAMHDSARKARREARRKEWKLSQKVEEDAWLANPKMLKRYACMDAVRTMLLWLLFEEKMEEFQVRECYDKEMDLWPCIYDMESRGVRVDRKENERQIQAHQKLIEDAHKKIQMILSVEGHEGLNIHSSKQLGEYLYGFKRIEPKIFTPKGTPSVSGEALTKIKSPLVSAILREKSSLKAISSFFRRYQDLSVPDHIVKGGWCLHPDFHQVGPATGRLSCRNPNMQNVPDAGITHTGAVPIQARMVLGPRPGYAWVHMDFKQQEIRIFAELSQEQKMVDALMNGRNIHEEATNMIYGGKNNLMGLRTLTEVFKYSIGKKSKDVFQELKKKLGGNLTHQRAAWYWINKFNFDIVEAEKALGSDATKKVAKMCSFLKIYGGGVRALAELLERPESECQEILDTYSRQFPKIERYSQERIRAARRDGYIRDVYGRRLSVSADKPYRAVNYEVQGSAASMIKDRMLAVYRWLKSPRMIKAQVDAHIILSVHDEQVLEVRKTHLTRWFLRALKRIGEDTKDRFKLPMPIDLEIAFKSWVNKMAVQI